MGYNPDANGDEFIGVDDVIGTLALFGNSFSNNDSIMTMDVTFPIVNEAGEELHFDLPDFFVIPEDVDVLNLTSLAFEESGSHPLLKLPQGNGFKTLLVFAKRTDPTAGAFHFYHDLLYAGTPNSILQVLGVDLDMPRFVLFLRSSDGQWHRSF